ncbi:LuxR C-terminal-related transcriptional regulator [Rhodococcus sp. NPDC058505]|uniref:LuxR C-terminal-related transcriptional regulator n=1 Tax=unclassified Rhodococcus (in: high G+C Gram-positive bacteria) TaxID=192944 RepID=UPI003668FCDF
MGVVERLVRARESYERREWVAAYEALSDAAVATALDGDDFARLAAAAHLTGRKNDCVAAWQRACQLRLESGDRTGAAGCAVQLAMLLLTTGEVAVGNGWVERAQRLLAEVPGDVVERGYLQIALMYRSLSASDFANAAARADDIVAHGRRFEDPDLIAMGLSARGRLALYAGAVPEGVALLDEAMVAISGGEVSTVFAGYVYCTVIEGCQEIADIGRMSEWTMALTTWCERQPGLIAFAGQCAVHRGQIMRWRGAFDAALEEFDVAVRRYLAADTPVAAGLATAERADVLRLRGDYDAAAAAYAQAVEYGHEPQPGMALLWLARGRTAAALGAARRLLAERADPVHRCSVLPAAVEILLAAGEIDEASVCAAELSATAERFGVDAVRAAANAAAGRVAAARSEPATAIAHLRRAARGWHDLGSRYEAARCRVRIGCALRDLGDETSAITEFESARRCFHTIGAAPAEHEVDMLLRPATPGGLTARELEVLRLVAAGRTNPAIAAELVLSEKTVARHLSNIFGKLNVTSRTAAAAFAFAHHLT